MNKGSTWWIVFFALVIVLVAGMRYYDYVVKKNFLFDVAVECDPSSETCFVWDCDVNDPECDSTPYKKVEILAQNSPKCLEEHSCENFSCDGLEECSVTTCSDETLDEGEVCTEKPSDTILPLVDVPAETATSTENNNE